MAYDTSYTLHHFKWILYTVRETVFHRFFHKEAKVSDHSFSDIFCGAFYYKNCCNTKIYFGLDVDFSLANDTSLDAMISGITSAGLSGTDFLIRVGEPPNSLYCTYF